MDQWYQRSDKDGDTHYGYLTDTNSGIYITARCGRMFRPLPPLSSGGLAFVRPPIDPRQACPECQSADAAPDTDSIVEALKWIIATWNAKERNPLMGPIHTTEECIDPEYTIARPCGRRAGLTVPELETMLDHLVSTAGSGSIWVDYVRGRIAALKEHNAKPSSPQQ